jgi:hypothetical protein
MHFHAMESVDVYKNMTALVAALDADHAPGAYDSLVMWDAQQSMT